MATFDDVYFRVACESLVEAVRLAAGREWFGDIDHVRRAVLKAKHVMREARRLGRYPSTHQLEQETRRAA